MREEKIPRRVVLTPDGENWYYLDDCAIVELSPEDAEIFYGYEDATAADIDNAIGEPYETIVTINEARIIRRD